MRRVSSAHAPMYHSISLACDDALVARLNRLAERDGVSRSRVVRELVEFALPAFEDQAEETAPTAVEAGEASG